MHLKPWIAVCSVFAAPMWDDDMQEFAVGDIPSDWVPLASPNICDFQGKWQLLLDKSDTLDPILTGLQFGWLKKKALRNFSPTTYIRFSERECYDSDMAYQTAMNVVQKFLPRDSDEGNEDPLEDEDIGWFYSIDLPDIEDIDELMMEGMKVSIVGKALESVAVEKPSLYMYMKTIFPWHNVKEGVVSVDGPVFEHHDSDTGLWRSAVTFKNGRVYQKRVSADYGTMFDIRAIFKPPFREIAADAELTDGRLLNLSTWSGTRPLMLFKWTLVAPDGQVYHSVRWNEKQDDDPNDPDDIIAR